MKIISRYSKAFLKLLSSNQSEVVEIDEFAVFPKLQYIFVSFGNKIGSVVHYDNNPLWISADTNKVRMWWLSELTVRD